MFLRKILDDSKAKRIMKETVMDGLDDVCGEIIQTANGINESAMRITNKLKNGGGEAIIAGFKTAAII